MSQHDEILPLILERFPECIVVYDDRLQWVYRNSRARKFLEDHELPEEIPSIARRIFAAIARNEVAARFPGHVGFPRRIGDSTWLFRVVFSEAPRPLVCVLFSNETASCRFDLNAARTRYSLTRREVDVLRRLLDGLRNLAIAEELGIAEQTVKEYVGNIYRKIGVGDRFSLLRHFMEAAVIPAEISGPPRPAAPAGTA